MKMPRLDHRADHRHRQSQTNEHNHGYRGDGDEEKGHGASTSVHRSGGYTGGGGVGGSGGGNSIWLTVLAGLITVVVLANVLSLISTTSPHTHALERGIEGGASLGAGESLISPNAWFPKKLRASTLGLVAGGERRKQKKDLAPGAAEVDDEDAELEEIETEQSAAASTGVGKAKYHVVVTTDGSVYSTWQTRVMHYWYRRHRESRRKQAVDMGGFTRILHADEADDFMDEMHTALVRPLRQKTHDYVVLNRPWAVMQWLKKASFPEEYVFIAEPDQIMLRPMPNLATPEIPAAYPYSFIQPTQEFDTLHRFIPGGVDTLGQKSLKEIYPVGPSPVLLHKEQLKKIAPTWYELAMAMKQDPMADKALGWVLEMYAFCAAAAVHGTQFNLRKDIMVQPPEDDELGDAYILHYAYGMDLDSRGRKVSGHVGQWRFDKRQYLTFPPPNNITVPSGSPSTIVKFIDMLNEASLALWTSSLPQYRL